MASGRWLKGLTRILTCVPCQLKASTGCDVERSISAGAACRSEACWAVVNRRIGPILNTSRTQSRSESGHGESAAGLSGAVAGLLRTHPSGLPTRVEFDSDCPGSDSGQVSWDSTRIRFPARSTFTLERSYEAINGSCR